MSKSKPHKTPKGDYEVGYARPPKASQFHPGQSGNLAGRPRGRPTLDEMFLEEAARIVKIKAGDKVLHLDKDRALLRKAFDMALQGDVRALQLVTAGLAKAQANASLKVEPETSLTEDELAVLGMLPDNVGA